MSRHVATLSELSEHATFPKLERDNAVILLRSKETGVIVSSTTETWLTRKQAAAYLKLGESTLAKLFVSGDGPPAIKVGRSVRYASDDLNTWMDSRRRRSTSDSGAPDGKVQR